MKNRIFALILFATILSTKGGHSQELGSLEQLSHNFRKESVADVSTHCAIQTIRNLTLVQVNLGVDLLFFGINQRIKSSDERTNSVEILKRRTYQVFRQSIVWTIEIASKIRSISSSKLEAIKDAALAHLNRVLNACFEAIEMTNNEDDCYLSEEIQKREDEAKAQSVAVIVEIYKIIAEVAKGHPGLQRVIEKNEQLSTNYIRQCAANTFFGIRILWGYVNHGEGCENCSTYYIARAQAQAKSAMDIQLDAQFEAINALCKEFCADRSGSRPQNCAGNY